MGRAASKNRVWEGYPIRTDCGCRPHLPSGHERGRSISVPDDVESENAHRFVSQAELFLYFKHYVYQKIVYKPSVTWTISANRPGINPSCLFLFRSAALMRLANADVTSSIMEMNKSNALYQAGRRSRRRARFIAATADLSAPAGFPKYWVQVHYRLSTHPHTTSRPVLCTQAK